MDKSKIRLKVAWSPAFNNIKEKILVSSRTIN